MIFDGGILMLKLKGWNHGSAKFSDMTDNEYLRSNFVKTSVEFLKAHAFDGLGNKQKHLNHKNKNKYFFIF